MNAIPSADTTTYVSTDIETDGLCPGLHSMIELGSVAITIDGKELASFTACLQPLPDATPLQSTMDWWSERPELLAEIRKYAQEPAHVMRSYNIWLRALPQPIVFVGYPASFDFAFVWYYLWRFVGEPPFAHGALDIKTLASVALHVPYMDARKGNWPPEWEQSELGTAHRALDDARSQARAFVALSSVIRMLRT